MKPLRPGWLANANPSVVWLECRPLSVSRSQFQQVLPGPAVAFGGLRCQARSVFTRTEAIKKPVPPTVAGREPLSDART
jgi:hypothetical protein